MASDPRNPCVVHPLPLAPSFVGRQGVLAELEEHWRSGKRGVVALVGLGGAGKTAIAAQFLDKLLRVEAGPRPSSVFVWSFYQEPDAGRFLQRLYEYLATGGTPNAAGKGAGLLHLLDEALSAPAMADVHAFAVGGDPLRGTRHLLMLDGLERVQQQDASRGAYGRIEDMLLRRFLMRLASPASNLEALTVVTSRFPLTDLGYVHINVGGLEPPAALSLLRQRGVLGDDAALARLIDAYGAHALTLDHLGGLIGVFLEGDPGRAPEVETLGAAAGDRQAARLSRLLRAYETHLPPQELALLCRLCLLRRSENLAELTELFVCHPAIRPRTARELPKLIERVPGVLERLGAEDSHDLMRSLRATVEDALCQAPLAGPETAFREETVAILHSAFEVHELGRLEYGEFARLYADQSLDTPTDLLPLNRTDREALRYYYARILELRAHPLMPCPDADPALEKAFVELGHGPKPSARRRPEGELGPHDVLLALQSVERYLRYLVAKHHALRRMREVCSLAAQKWALAGPLAEIDATGLERLLNALVERHLVLCEADGSFTVHPAIRDHFARVAKAAEGGAWHDLLRRQFISLVSRPGARQAEDDASLDLIEEAIHHALRAGRAPEALELYNDALGGMRRLAWKLGEAARGLRILQEFDPCPDPWALGWYWRALGDLDEAYRHNSLPYFRADIRLLQGRLPEVVLEGEGTRTAVAAFLMGQTTKLPRDVLGCAIPRDQLCLYLGRFSVGQSSALLEGLYRDIGWESDRARCLLLLAEACRRRSDETQAHHFLVEASRWILHSGSVEHLCLYHLTRARILRSSADYDAAQRAVAERAVAEGLHLAERSGLGLYHIELLCERAESSLALGEAAGAEQTARDALRRARDPKCTFAWGEAEAGHLLGQALAEAGRSSEARTILGQTLALRRNLGHPDTTLTERALARLQRS
jgi:hypothetical protein